MRLVAGSVSGKSHGGHLQNWFGSSWSSDHANLFCHLLRDFHVRFRTEFLNLTMGILVLKQLLAPDRCAIHWRRLVKNIGGNQNFSGNVVNTDKCMGVSRFLKAHAPGLPPQVYAYGAISCQLRLPSSCLVAVRIKKCMSRH